MIRDPYSRHICLIEPYMTGSHKQWAEGLVRHSRHHIDVLTLEGRFWKWRLQGGAITLAEHYMARVDDPDLIVATDMLDLSTFLALTRSRTSGIPVVAYFHENQLTYPWSPRMQKNLTNEQRHYGLINYRTALVADEVWFNSAFHRRSFLEALQPLLQHYPDHRQTESIDRIAAKSRFCYLGMDLQRFDRERPAETAHRSDPPRILWNHRWEHDKNPRAFFRLLYTLAEEGLPFEVVILGENTRQKPEEFWQARERLQDRIVQFGYTESFSDYARWLFDSDILPVTSNQDFFGLSVIEALYCGCTPLLPRRLAYPELIDPDLFDCFYTTRRDLKQKLSRFLSHPRRWGDTGRQWAFRFDWSQRIPDIDTLLDRAASVRYSR